MMMQQNWMITRDQQRMNGIVDWTVKVAVHPMVGSRLALMEPRKIVSESLVSIVVSVTMCLERYTSIGRFDSGCSLGR